MPNLEDTVERRRAYNKAYHAANRDKINARHRAYSISNAERISIKSKAYKKAHYAANLDIYRARSKAYYAANVDKLLARNRVYRAENPDKIKNVGLRKRYGLTLDGVAQLLTEQGGVCKICGGTDWGKGTPHVDHSDPPWHIRGILCGLCNPGLGYFRQDPALLRAAASYLEADAILFEEKP